MSGQSTDSRTDFITKQIQRLLNVFPSARLSEDGMDGYVEALMGIRDLHLEQAIAECIRKVKYFPKVAEIVKFADDIKYGKTGHSGGYTHLEQHRMMCQGMDEEEMNRYLADQKVSLGPAEYKWLKAEIAKHEVERARILAAQWSVIHKS